jgi:pimeloyl-ACP methyl ester carboxylesterase
MKDTTIELSTGISTTYVEVGEPEGQAVLLLHGYTDTRRSMLGVLAHLARLRPDLRFIACDLRGHGQASMPAPGAYRHAPERAFGIGDFAADAIGLLDALGIDRAHLIGHSLGSFIAQEIALTRNERVDQLVLIGSAVKAAGNAAIEQMVIGELLEGTWRPALEARGLVFPRDVYALTPRDADPNVERWLLANWVNEPLASPDLLRQIVAETASTPLGTWIGVARAVLEMDNRERLQALTAPTLVLWATQDSVCPEHPDQQALLACLDRASQRTGMRYYFRCFGERLLPPSGLTEDDLGHNFHWAIPELVAGAIAGFLAVPAARGAASAA